MTSVHICTRCGGARVERKRPDLADALNVAMQLADREAETERKYRCLVAQLVWFESELRGRCTNCTLEESAAAFAVVAGPAARALVPATGQRPYKPTLRVLK